MALTYITITGTFDDGSDNPLSGQVVFTPSQTVYASGIPVASMTNPVIVQVISGSLQTVKLLSTSNAGLTFAGLTGFFTWSVQITLGGITQPGWSFFLPLTPTTVDLYSLANTAVASSLYVPIAGGTMTGELVAPDVSISGLTGAVAASRYVGATASGAPASGTFAVGDFVIDQTGKVWICTTAGSPGRWTAAGPTIPVTISQGGTGQTTAAAALTALGGLAAANNLSDLLSAAKARHNLAPWVFDVTDAAYGAKGNGICVIDGAITSGTANLACATSTPFTSTAVDGGKTIIVKGAGASGAALVTTISTVTDSGHAVLAANAGTTVSGAITMFGTDDTAAFQAAVNAAVAYAQAHAYYAEVLVPASSAAFYMIAGSLVTGGSTHGNAQIALPVITPASQKVTLVIRGGENASGLQHWQQTYPQLGGPTLVSAGLFASAGAQGTSINNNGNPCVIGGPAQPAGYGTSATLFSNMLAVVQGLNIQTVYSSTGLNYCALDFSGVAEANIFDSGIGTTGTVVGGDYNTPAGFATGSSKGVLMPANGNNDNNAIRNLTIGGGYAEGLLMTEHCVIDALRILYCWSALVPVGAYFSSVGSNHAMYVNQMSVEGCTNLIRIRGSGQSGIGPMFDIAQLDTEASVPTFTDDGSNGMLNAIGTIGLKGQFTISAITTSPTGLKILNGQQPPGPVTMPNYTLGTPFQNPFWKDWLVSLVGGAVTAIKQGATIGGTVAPSMTSTGMVSGTFIIPAGGWLEIDGTVKPTVAVSQAL